MLPLSLLTVVFLLVPLLTVFLLALRSHDHVSSYGNKRRVSTRVRKAGGIGMPPIRFLPASCKSCALP